MEYSVIVLTSVTAAQRVSRIAEQYGITCSFFHTPKVISKNGCSHCIKARKEYTNVLVEICGQLGLDVRGVYIERKNYGLIDYIEMEEYHDLLR